MVVPVPQAGRDGDEQETGLTRTAEPKKTPDVDSFEGPRLRVALCQVETREWDVAGNLTRTLASVDEAAAAGAHLAITPECVLHGYARPGSPLDRRLAAAAEAVDGASLREIQQRAAATGMAVALGFAERAPDGRLYNALALLDPSGELVLHYRKVHLRDFEAAGTGGAFTAGDSFSVSPLVFPGGSCRVGGMICFDREVPETLRCLRALGAELVVCPLACDTSDAARPRSFVDNELITRVRAAENEVFIAVVNHAGRFNGGSWIAGPGGEVIVQMGDGPGVATVDLPVGIVPSAFHSDPLGWMGWGYRRPSIYTPYLDPGALERHPREDR